MELFVQGTFSDGAKDEALSSSSEVFPLDVVGRPTFRPSAKWFLAQCDFTTAVKPLQTRMSSVVAAGPHLQLNKKVKGTCNRRASKAASGFISRQTVCSNCPGQSLTSMTAWATFLLTRRVTHRSPNAAYFSLPRLSTDRAFYRVAYSSDGQVCAQLRQ